MKERRRFQRWSAHQIWGGVWFVIVTVAALYLAVLMEKAQAYEDPYGLEQPYPGWHADMEYQQWRQNQLLEESLRLQRQQERRQQYEDSQRRARDHSEDLRTNWGHGW